MHGKWLVVALALSLPAHSALAKQLVVAWDWRQTPPATWTMTLTGLAGGQPVARKEALTLVSQDTCRNAKMQDIVSETLCAVLPCPAAGLYQMLVQGEGEMLPPLDQQVDAQQIFRVTESCTVIAYQELTQTTTAPGQTLGTGMSTMDATSDAVPSLDIPELTNLSADELERRLAPPPAPPTAVPIETTPMADVMLPPLVTTPLPAAPPPPPPPLTRTDVQRQLDAIRQSYAQELRQIQTQYLGALATVGQLPPARQATAALEAYTKGLEAQAQAYARAQTSAQQVYARVGQKP